MKRSALALGAAIFTAAVAPGAASAEVLQLGVTSSPVVAPVCPAGVSQSNCKIVLEQMTAVETLRDGVTYPSFVQKPGEVVSFTLGISAINSNKATVSQDVKYLNSVYGGPPSAQLTILRPVGSGKSFRWSVAAQSQPVQLIHYLGQVAQFPVTQPLPVVPGELVALTVPTWAPVLSFDLTSGKFAYRQSRRTQCSSTNSAEQGMLTIGQQSVFGCSFSGTRVEYSATEIVTPTPSDFRKARRRS